MKKEAVELKTFRIPETGIPHYVQGQGVIPAGGTYRAPEALADGDEEVADAPASTSDKPSKK